MKKIEELFHKLAGIGADSLLHVLVSLIIAGVFCGLMEHLCYDPFLPPTLALFFTMLLGIGKEVYDSYKPDGEFSWHDLAFDLVGVVIGILMVSI